MKMFGTFLQLFKLFVASSITWNYFYKIQTYKINIVRYKIWTK